MPFFQQKLLDFAACGLGELLNERDVLWNFVFGYFSFKEFEDFSLPIVSPGLSTMKALPTSPHFSSGTPMIPDQRSSGGYEGPFRFRRDIRFPLR